MYFWKLIKIKFISEFLNENCDFYPSFSDLCTDNAFLFFISQYTNRCWCSSYILKLWQTSRKAIMHFKKNWHQIRKALVERIPNLCSYFVNSQRFKCYKALKLNKFALSLAWISVCSPYSLYKNCVHKAHKCAENTKHVCSEHICRVYARTLI